MAFQPDPLFPLPGPFLSWGSQLWFSLVPFDNSYQCQSLQMFAVGLHYQLCEASGCVNMVKGKCTFVQ